MQDFNKLSDINGMAFDAGLYPLNETGMNRILSHGKSGMIIISANRSDIKSDNKKVDLLPEFKKWCEENNEDFMDESVQKSWRKKRNEQANADLLDELRKSKYAYSHVFGGYHGTDDGEVFLNDWQTWMSSIFLRKNKLFYPLYK